MSGDWREDSVQRAERENFGGSKKPTTFRWTGNSAAQAQFSVETSEPLFEPDGTRIAEDFPFYKRHFQSFLKLALVVFFIVLIGGSAVWWTCAICPQKLKTLGGQPNASEAVCLDGEAAGYYLDVEDDTKHWVIWLQGGGVCPNLKECQYRSIGPLGSSKTWPSKRNPGDLGDGILSNWEGDNPGFHKWSKVFIPYCSGDAWMGQQKGEFDPWGNNKGVGALHFAGHTIIEKVIDELVAEHGLDSADAVLLAGASDGGMAVFQHVDWLQQRLPKVDVKGNPQAGWFGAPIKSWRMWFQRTPDPDPTRWGAYDWIMNINYFHWPALNKCQADANAGQLALPGYMSEAVGRELTVQETVKACFFPPVFYKYVEAPLFISENTADGYQILILADGDEGSNDYVKFYRSYLSGSLTTGIIDQHKKNRTVQDGLFAPACLAHCMQYATDVSGNDPPKIHELTHAQAINGWYHQTGNPHGDSPNGKWKLLDNNTKLKTIQKCGTPSGPLLALCLLPVMPRNLFG